MGYLSGLNSFYEGHANKDKVMKELRNKLDSLGHKDLVLLVTHQVIILEQTGVAPRSGEMVLYNSLTKQKHRHIIDN